MRLRRPLLSATLFILLLPSFTAQAAGVTYHWVDADGRLQLSDTLPSRATEQGYKVLDSASGQVIREVLPRKTAEEKAREAAAEQARHEAEEQARRDNTLLSLYASVDDIERARDEQLERMDARIRQMQRSIKRMQETVAAGHREVSYARDLGQLQQALKDARIERSAMAEHYEVEIQRFRRLQQDR